MKAYRVIFYPTSLTTLQSILHTKSVLLLRQPLLLLLGLCSFPFRAGAIFLVTPLEWCWYSSNDQESALLSWTAAVAFDSIAGTVPYITLKLINGVM